ncbi:MAG: fumarylacetoacetase [Phycisphaeraceae bacterium]|nr:fumarylacetoacetase [Phycisphaeraceae bacterium]
MTNHQPKLDHTHDASLRSWVEPANNPATLFPIQNLPLCVFEPRDGATPSGARPGVAIGDRVFSLRDLAAAKLFDNVPGLDAGIIHSITQARDLLWFMQCPASARTALRHRLVDLFREDNHSLRDNPNLLRAASFAHADVLFHLPVAIGDYTDFYASIHHARTVGSMFRPDNPLLPNYKHIPIGYHGRASSIVISGTPIRRPRGQQQPAGAPADAPPVFAPSAVLDYELEVGCFIGPGNTLGSTIPIADAVQHAAGLCLVNDWSARDVQRWEYQPLGPFLAKNFATTISPFLITMDALEPFRVQPMARAEGDPSPLPYLTDVRDQSLGAIDISLEVTIQTQAMRQSGTAPFTVSRSAAFRELYWTFAQMIAHHASGGCNLRPGDLIASGTVSGNAPETRGCLLERTWAGIDPASGKPLPRTPLSLPSGETRTFLADGDSITLRGLCRREGFRTIGLGDCEGTILPAGE